MASLRFRTATGAAALVFASVVSAGCSSAGPYGYAQLYSPLDAETDAAGDSVPFDPSAARRKPDVWRGRLVSTFGVVLATEPAAGGRKALVSVRGLQPRNLCDGPDEQSCRVTVTETEFAQVWTTFTNAAVVPKTNPPDPIQRGSLLRVIGKLQPAATEGEPSSISATLVRHWPLQTYVTTGARDSMRR